MSDLIADEQTDAEILGAVRAPALTGCPGMTSTRCCGPWGCARPASAWRWDGCCSARGDRHLTAEMLYEEATQAKVPVSLATVYNTLNQLTEAGLLRQVSVDGTKTYFDTNVTAHHHFYMRRQPRAGRYSRPAFDVAEDAGRAGRLRDRPHRHGGAAARRSADADPGRDHLKQKGRAQRGAFSCGLVSGGLANRSSRRRRRPTAAAARSSRRSRCR